MQLSQTPKHGGSIPLTYTADSIHVLNVSSIPELDCPEKPLGPMRTSSIAKFTYDWKVTRHSCDRRRFKAFVWTITLTNRGPQPLLQIQRSILK
jgi:hypothetical protein